MSQPALLQAAASLPGIAGPLLVHGAHSAARPSDTNKHLESLPKAVNVILLLLAGGVAAGLGWIGWHRAERIVPTSLPETLYRHRCRVVRRGSVGFFIIGVVLIGVGVFVVFAT